MKRTIESKLQAVVGTRCIFHVILDKGKTECLLKLFVRDQGQQRDFGRDTNEILIGAFLSKSEQSIAARARAIADLRLVLADLGVADLRELDDPFDGR